MMPTIILAIIEAIKKYIRVNKYWIPILVGCFGVTISLINFSQMRHWKQQRIQAEFERSATAYQVLYQIRLNRIFSYVDSLTRFYAASEFVTRDEFKQYTVPVLNEDQELKAILWVPRVFDRDRLGFETTHWENGLGNKTIYRHILDGEPNSMVKREVYYPIAYIEPIDSQIVQVGLDLASNFELNLLLDQARDSGKRITTHKVGVTKEEKQRIDALVIQPIYQAGVVIDSIEQRQKNLKGFVLLQFDIGVALEIAISTIQASGIDIHVLDRNTIPGNQSLYLHYSLFKNQPIEKISTIYFDNTNKLEHEAKINIAEQQWSLLFKSIPAYIKLHRQWQSWVILLFVFTITTVLSLYIFSGFRRADKIEAKVLERTAELSKAMDAMREAKLEAERASLAKSQFLSRMSHELRTPMNAILGFSQLLKTDKESTFSKSQYEKVNEILDAGHHLLALIDEVLDLAKMESGNLKVTLEEVQVSEVTRSCISLIKSQADYRSISIINTISRDEYDVVHADAIRLKQVLLNLISNAVKYNREGGIVTLSSKKTGNRIRISVKDTGFGISDVDQQHIFNSFERLANARGIDGVGIGLVITKNLVEMMGGTIGVTSSPQEGSTFWVELDCLKSKSMSEIVKPEKNNLLKSKKTGKKTILYIEDNFANLIVVTQLIKQHSNIELLTATSGAQGLLLVATHQPDVILLDINMPGMNGYEVLEKLKSQSKTAEIPVIAVTANAMQCDIEKGSVMGFSYYLTKPINLSQMLNVIDKILNETEHLSE